MQALKIAFVEPRRALGILALTIASVLIHTSFADAALKELGPYVKK